MNRLAGLVSRLLKPEERAAVMGDIAELQETGWQALRGVAGLVVRRQIALWKDWRPWLALFGLGIVVGPDLWRVGLAVGSPIALDFRTYLKYGSLYAGGMTLGEEARVLLCQSLGLVLWSWTSGFALSSLSRRTIWITGAFYYHLWIYLSPIAALLFWMFGRHPHNQDLLSALLVTGVQTAVLIVLLLLPSVLGIREGLRKRELTSLQLWLLAFSIASITILATWTGGWPAAALTRWAGGAWDPSPGWLSRLGFYGMLGWPAVYLLLTAKHAPFAKMKGHGEF